MIPYNPSSFDTNKTILEQILELKNWLKDHPSYEIFYSSENGNNLAYTGYLLSAIADPTNLAVGDVVIFTNVMVGVVTSVDSDNGTYGCDACVSFEGPQGATGPAGADGQNGTDGTCIRYCNYNKNSNPNTTYGITDLNFSNGLQINDCILFKNNFIGFVDNINVGLGNFRVTGNINIKGKDGKYVSNAEVDANGDLLIYITDPETSLTTIDNVGHVVGPQGSGIQIVALTSTSGTLSADDLSKVTGTDDCIITYTNAGSTIVFKRASIDSSYAYFTNVVVDGDTYYLACEVDITTGQYNLGMDELPIKASNVNSETATNGQVLTADGNGGASWQSAGGGGSVEGVDVLSTGVSIGKFLKANGTGGAVWDNASTGKNIHYVRLDCSSPYMRIYFSFVDVSSTSSTTITQVINRLSASMSQSWILANGLYIYQGVAYPIYAIASQNGVLQIGYNDGTAGQTITSSQVTLTVNYDKVFIL